MEFDTNKNTYKKLDKMLRSGIIIQNDDEEVELNYWLSRLNLPEFEVEEEFEEELVIRVNFEDYGYEPDLEWIDVDSTLLQRFTPLIDFINEIANVTEKHAKKKEREIHEFNKTFQLNSALQTIQPSIISAAASIQQTTQTLTSLNTGYFAANASYTLDDWVHEWHTGITQRH